jgi:hypothetical protein
MYIEVEINEIIGRVPGGFSDPVFSLMEIGELNTFYFL